MKYLDLVSDDENKEFFFLPYLYNQYFTGIVSFVCVSFIEISMQNTFRFEKAGSQYKISLS
jgi:hypothetical protein